MLSSIDLCLDFKTGIKKVELGSTTNHKCAWFRSIESILLFKEMLDEWIVNNRKINEKAYLTQVQRIATNYGAKSNLIISTYSIGSTAKKKSKKKKKTILPSEPWLRSEEADKYISNETKPRSIARSKQSTDYRIDNFRKFNIESQNKRTGSNGRQSSTKIIKD